MGFFSFLEDVGSSVVNTFSGKGWKSDREIEEEERKKREQQERERQVELQRQVEVQARSGGAKAKIRPFAPKGFLSTMVTPTGGTPGTTTLGDPGPGVRKFGG